MASAAGAAPLIAVSSGFTDYGDYLGLALSRPLLAAGGLPMVLPYIEDRDALEALLDRVGGVLLGFGRDLGATCYGLEPHPAMTEVSPHRDEFELALALASLERRLPVLAICRGMQVLNVALGGSLHRDRSEYPAAARGHPGGDWERWDLVCAATLGDGPMPEHPSHPIEVAAGSRLACALGERAVVNSYHHQAVDRLGEGLEAVARAPDGIVEALELPHERFVVGVQWEAQVSWHDDPRGDALFGAFVAAARSSPAAAERA